MAEFLLAWFTTMPTTAEILGLIALMAAIRFWRTGRMHQLLGRKVQLRPMSFPPTVHEGVQDAWILMGIVLPYSVLRAASQVGWI